MPHLFKVPGAYVFALVGPFGSGKSLSMIELGLDAANFFEKPIASNFALNRGAIYRYAKHFGLNWIRDNIRSCSLINHYSDIRSLLEVEDSVILLDEGGVDLFSRGWNSSERKFWLDRLFRIRHYRNYLIYACQDIAQIDKQFRIMTHSIIYCDGFQLFNRSRRAFDLHIRKYFIFQQIDFEKFYTPDYRGKVIYPIYKSQLRFCFRPLFLLKLFGLRRIKEDYLFDCYNSFDKYDSVEEVKPQSKIQSLKSKICWVDFDPVKYAELLRLNPDA